MQNYMTSSSPDCAVSPGKHAGLTCLILISLINMRDRVEWHPAEIMKASLSTKVVKIFSFENAGRNLNNKTTQRISFCPDKTCCFHNMNAYASNGFSFITRESGQLSLRSLNTPSRWAKQKPEWPSCRTALLSVKTVMCCSNKLKIPPNDDSSQ